MGIVTVLGNIMLAVQGFPEAPDLLPGGVTPSAPGGGDTSTPGGVGGLLPGEGVSESSELIPGFLESALFGQVQGFATIVGIAFLVYLVIATIKRIVASDIIGAVKVLSFGAIVAAMLFNLELPIRFAEGLTGFIMATFEALLGVTD